MSPQTRLTEPHPDSLLIELAGPGPALPPPAEPAVVPDRADQLDRLDAGRLTVVALLNCFVREVAGPRGQTRADGSRLRITLPATGLLLRAGLRRLSQAEPSLTGEVEEWAGRPGWLPLTWNQLAHRVDAELAGPGGEPGPGLIHEISASHAFIAAVLQRRARSDQPGPEPEPAQGRDGGNNWLGFLASEQSLIAGHRFHPAPKARSGAPGEALTYAPEIGAGFRLRWLAAPAESVVQHETRPGAAALFDHDHDAVAVPDGYLALPVHPWQYRILLRTAALPDALATGRLIDLGELGRPVRPTSSVRTVARADDRGFLKLSLAVQITNCLRLNPPHEIEAAVIADGALQPLRGELAELWPGTVVLAEPASRTVDLGSADPRGELAAGLGVIARQSLMVELRAGVLPVPAAALVEPVPVPVVSAVLDPLTTDRDALVAWWDSYLGRLLPPVLHAFLAHGVVFEAHLQNVVVGLGDRDGGRPGSGSTVRQLVLRDLEGVKLVGPRHAGLLAQVPPKVADHLSYSADRGWDRVAYCLFVNNVSGLLSALADRAPSAERVLWDRVRTTVRSFRRDHGDAPQLRDVLAGHPLPAKTNLLTRRNRNADQDSGYVPVGLPIGTSASPIGPRAGTSR